MHGCDFMIYDMIARNAVLYPEKCAIVFGEKRISFSDYQKLCDQCATGLIKEGVKIGDRVAILSSNCDDFMVLCGAAAKIGAIVVAVNFRLSEGEVEYILKDTEPKCLFISKECQELACKASEKVISIQKRYVFASDKGEYDFIPFGTLLLDEKIEQIETISGDLPYMILHTAAVGGKPRGAMLSQANILSVGLQMDYIVKITGSDCHVGTMPLVHIGGFGMTIGVMQLGGKNVIMERFDPMLVLKLTVREQGTFFGTFPPMLTAFMDAQDKESIDTPTLRGVGWVESPANIERFMKRNPQATFYSLYGQGESMPVSGCDVKDKPGSIGLPAPMTRVAIFDDLDHEVPVGVQGEMCVRSPSVFQGYWNLKGDTARTLRNGWHHTGDLGRIDKDGFIWYGGRKPEKELIKPGGENVYPAEVEKTILSHECVEEVAVFGVPDEQWGEAVQAVCVLKKGTNLSETELIDFVASKIARYKKPKHVLFVDNLPKTASGAINREELKKTYAVKK